MKHTRRNQTELLSILEHLNYEIEMFYNVANGLFSGIFNDGIIKNALVESFNIHTRTILEFFYAKDPRDDDVIAEDFFNDDLIWPSIRPAKTELLIKAHSRIGKELAHLTYLRNQLTRDAKLWNIQGIYNDLDKVIQIFITSERKITQINWSLKNNFYVYENWVAEGHKARIHLANCSFCNNGKGIHKTVTSANGVWHGPFDTIKDAQIAASNTGGHVSKCKHCNPT